MRYLALITLIVIACGSAPASGSTLILVFHKGDVYRFSLDGISHVSINPAAPDTIHQAAHLTYTVISVDAGGNADVALVTTDAVITATDGPVTPPPGMELNGTTELKVASDGRVLNQTVNGSVFAGGIWWAVLPGTAVKPGATWTNVYDVSYPGYSVTIHYAAKSKYVRDELFRATSAAVVESTIVMSTTELPTANATSTVTGTATVTVTTWLDRGAGRVLKSHLVSTSKATFTDPTGSTAPTVVTDDQTSDLLPV